MMCNKQIQNTSKCKHIHANTKNHIIFSHISDLTEPRGHQDARLWRKCLRPWVRAGICFDRGNLLVGTFVMHWRDVLMMNTKWAHVFCTISFGLEMQGLTSHQYQHTGPEAPPMPRILGSHLLVAPWIWPAAAIAGKNGDIWPPAIEIVRNARRLQGPY